MKINPQTTLLVIIDMQEKLMEKMYRSPDLLHHVSLLLKGADIFQIPCLYTEQKPEKIGYTSATLQSLLGRKKAIIKDTFSCWGSESFRTRIKEQKRQQIVVAGIEAHVCVYQSVLDFLQAGYEVYIVADAISSRNPAHQMFALERMKQEGALVAITEMLLFEWAHIAEGEAFKQVLSMVK